MAKSKIRLTILTLRFLFKNVQILRGIDLYKLIFCMKKNQWSGHLFLRHFYAYYEGH